MTIGERIKQFRESMGVTQTYLAEKIGTTKQTIYKYENNIITNIPSDKIEAISNFFCVSPAALMGWDSRSQKGSVESSTKQNRINVYGSVPAGIPVEAIEDIVDWEDIPKDWISDDQQYIGLRVKGDSMYPKYIEGDTIIVRLQPDCESGQDAVVYVNGYDATLKKVLKNDDGIMLQPLNPEYAPKQYDYDDERYPISILGVVVEIRRKV